MSDARQTVPEALRTEPGHLAVRVEGLRPPELVFSFERQPKRLSGAMVGSLAAHGLIVVFAVLMTLFGPKAQTTQVIHEPSRDIVWLVSPGTGGGGGGGGSSTPEPPQKAELPGKQKITVPAVKPPEVKPAPKPPDTPPPPPEENLRIPAATLGDSDQPLPGVIEGVSADVSTSRGSGTGPGAGEGGEGTGIGPGRGSGLGEGFEAGTGGGYYRPGSGVENPRIIREVKPKYTADAMRAKVQGTVWVEAVVMEDGTVGQVRISRSLDQTFGLDQEALEAAKQWRFVPGTRFGRPVPVLVTIELTFTLR